MKKCSRCKERKRVSSFSWSNRSKGYRRADCKKCRPEISKIWKKTTTEQKEEHSRKSIIKQRERADRNVLYVADYLHQHPCVKCGQRNIIVLEFHHRDPKQKTGKLSVMVGTGKSLESIKSEITKCDVMCANCHRAETAHQMNYRILKYQTVASVKVAQQALNLTSESASLSRPTNFSGVLVSNSTAPF